MHIIMHYNYNYTFPELNTERSLDSVFIRGTTVPTARKIETICRPGCEERVGTPGHHYMFNSQRSQ